MKRIAIITSLFLLCTTSAFAVNNFYIDILGAYINAGDAERQVGGGYSVGYNIVDNVNIIQRSTFSSGSQGINNYTYMFIGLGVDYTWFFWNRFGLRAGLLFGASPMKYDDDAAIHKDVNGFGAMIFAGFHATITQYVAVFLDVGFHYDYYKEGFGPYPKPSVLGETIHLGLRFTIGKNKRMSDGY